MGQMFLKQKKSSFKNSPPLIFFQKQLICAGMIVLAFNFPLVSQAKRELSSPLFLSQGGAGGASLKEDFSYLINPATMGFQKKAKGVLSYSFNQSRQTALVSFAVLC